MTKADKELLDGIRGLQTNPNICHTCLGDGLMMLRVGTQRSVHTCQACGGSGKASEAQRKITRAVKTR